MDIKTLTKEVEKVSKHYTKKFGIIRDSDWFMLKLQEELGELTQSYLKLIGKGRSGQKSEGNSLKIFVKKSRMFFVMFFFWQRIIILT